MKQNTRSRFQDDDIETGGGEPASGGDVAGHRVGDVRRAGAVRHEGALLVGGAEHLAEHPGRRAVTGGLDPV